MFKNRQLFVLLVCALLLLALSPATVSASSLLERLRARRASGAPTDIPPQPISEPVTAPEGPVIMEPVAPPTTPGAAPVTQPTSQPTAHGAQPAGPGPAAPTAQPSAPPRAIPRAPSTQPPAAAAPQPAAPQPTAPRAGSAAPQPTAPQPAAPRAGSAAAPQPTAPQPAAPRAGGAPNAASRLAERVSGAVNTPRTYAGETLPEVAGLTDIPEGTYCGPDGQSCSHSMQPPEHLRDPSAPGQPAAATDPGVDPHYPSPSREQPPTTTPFPADFTPQENTLYRRLPNGRIVMTDISPQGEALRSQSSRV